MSTLVPVDVKLHQGGEEEEKAEKGAVDGDGSGKSPSKEPSGCDDGKEWEQRISGYVSRSGGGVGRSDNDRQFFFLNGRPVDLPRVTRLVNEVWRLYEMKHKPAAILNLQAPPGSYDVNVTPDKREVFLVGEATLLERLKEALNSLWQPSSSSHVYTVNEAQVRTKKGAEAVLYMLLLPRFRLPLIVHIALLCSPVNTC